MINGQWTCWSWTWQKNIKIIKINDKVIMNFLESIDLAILVQFIRLIKDQDYKDYNGNVEDNRPGHLRAVDQDNGLWTKPYCCKRLLTRHLYLWWLVKCICDNFQRLIKVAFKSVCFAHKHIFLVFEQFALLSSLHSLKKKVLHLSR